MRALTSSLTITSLLPRHRPQVGRDAGVMLKSAAFPTRIAPEHAFTADFSVNGPALSKFIPGGENRKRPSTQAASLFTEQFNLQSQYLH